MKCVTNHTPTLYTCDMKARRLTRLPLAAGASSILAAAVAATLGATVNSDCIPLSVWSAVRHLRMYLPVCVTIIRLNIRIIFYIVLLLKVD